MKNIIKTDFFIQSLLLAGAVVSLVLVLFNKSFLLLLLRVQTVLGVWQFAAAAIAVVFRGLSWKIKWVYVLTSCLYLLTLWAYFEFNAPGNALGIFSYILGLFIIPWALALFYYSITIKIYKSTRESGHGFLPHTSF